ncbi:MAG: Type IV secretion system protein virB1 [Syntrophorhabdus sp. PtaB.Bin006]|nr:MAG: Type IV secretion system protein virB1 [Syntrophorhabdus sp. PtaB.Bin006]
MIPLILLSGIIGFSSLYGTCGPEVHPATTQAIVEVESSGNPLAIHDNDTGASYTPSTRSQAVEIATRLLARRHSIDIGLMQINSWHLRKRRIDCDSLFDPCFNIKTGTEILAAFYRTHRQKNPSDPPDLTLLKSLSSYNTGTPYNGTRYVTKILKKARTTQYIPTIKKARLVSTRMIPCSPQNAITYYRKEKVK